MLSASRVEDIAQDAVNTLSNPLTLELRAMANGANWPAHLIASLEVGYDEGDLVINYPEEFKEEIENLEYGDINSLPNAVLRPFMLRSPMTIERVLASNSLGALMTEMGVV